MTVERVVVGWETEKQRRRKDVASSHLGVFVLYSAPEVVTPSSKLRVVLSLWF